jgi:hypothetical protein
LGLIATAFRRGRNWQGKNKSRIYRPERFRLGRRDVEKVAMISSRK